MKLKGVNKDFSVFQPQEKEGLGRKEDETFDEWQERRSLLIELEDYTIICSIYLIPLTKRARHNAMQRGICKRYRGTNKGRIAVQRNGNRPQFDYIYNSPFPGSVLHHLRYEFPVIGMYVPGELHRRIGHSHKIKESMTKINLAVYAWFIGGEKEKWSA